VLLQGWMYHGCLFAAVLHWVARGRARLLWGIRHSIHDLTKETHSVRLILRVLAWLSPRVALCVYPSKVAAAQHADLGIRCRETQVVANGFELERFQVPDAQHRARARQRFGLAADECAIVHVARYHQMKDHAGLLHAFAAALRRVPTLRLIMAGQGVVVQNPSLAALVDQLGVSRQVMLLGELSDVREALAAGDCFCLSSKWGEAFPNAVGEAMAMGLPAICTDVGDCREIVGDAGWILPPGDPAALADAMSGLAGLSMDERRRIGAQARERVEQRYDLGRCVAAYEQLYAAQLAEQ
jgi:glycosyltransferase involved in cell wall biosynthesis